MATPLVSPAPVPDERFETIPNMVRRRAAERPDLPALHDGDRVVSWGALGHWMERIAARLRVEGLATGDTVASVADTMAEHVAVYLGTLAAGGCMAPLPGSAGADALHRMIADSGARFLFASERLRYAVDAIRDQLPAGRFIGLDFAADGWPSLDAWLGDAAEDAAPVSVGPDDLFDIIYSSGTTGTPKGIVHDHCFRSRQVARMANYELNADAVNLASTPLYSNTTLVSVLPTLALGGTLVLMRKFDARGFLELAERYRVTHAMLVPVQYQRILAVDDFDRFDLSAFRVKLCTSAPLRAAVTREVLDRWPGRLFNVYGMTEGGVSTVLDAAAFPDKLDSVGRPAAGADVRIIDEQGRALPHGEVGEIVGRSTIMMCGYHNAEAPTRDVLWQAPDGAVFIRTGDLGRFDKDGFLHLLDRRKDMIISGGFNVYASDLEQVLLGHPDVVDAAVIAVPSDAWGETPLGLVVPRPDRTLDEAEVLAWVNARLGRMQRLSAVEVRESLPRSAIGKVLKRELRAPYWNGR
ncbi:MAG TPA: class I adenylate-forming enzyme family protein [Azospirillum sp.]|nr:class I adenylate-forming enzyme family protein [Azospirillum sp.]